MTAERRHESSVLHLVLAVLVFSIAIMWSVIGVHAQDTGSPNLAATTARLSTSHIYLNPPGGGSDHVDIYLNCPGYVFQDTEYIDLIISSNSRMDVDIESVSNNVIHAKIDGSGVTNLKLYLYDPYKLDGDVVIDLGTFSREYLTLNKTGAVIKKKGRVQLNVQSTTGSIRNSDMHWASSNPSIASVDTNGLVRGKKAGNALITAITPGGNKVACVVSVITKKQSKILNKANKIVKTCRYSQARRMQKRYYDCSSLVWKAYKAAGKRLVNKSYAPPAASQYRYFVKHHKSLGHMTQNKLNKMKFRVGDLCYKTDGYTKRYKHIYHVEMFAGYTCSVNDDGTVSIFSKGIRSGLGGSSSFIARP